MRMAYKSVITILTLWGTTSLVQGQATLPPEGRSQPRATTATKLSREARQFARDYHNILEDVSDLYSDYGDYFHDVENLKLAKISASIEKTGQSLDMGVYNSDPSNLKVAMETLARLCAQFEKEAGHTAPDRKGLKLSRTLENDLEQLVFDLDEIIEEQKEFSSAENSAIGRYISDSLATTADIDIDKLTRQIEQLARMSAKLAGKATEHVLDSLSREMERAYAEFEQSKKSSSRSHSKRSVTIVMPEIPDLPELPETPIPSVAPVPVIIGGHSVVVHSGDEVSVVSQLEDSLTLPRRQMPVKISSLYGNVVVSGVSGRRITVSSEIMINARTEREARNATRQINLSAIDSNGIAVINLKIPGFDDPRTRLASSQMVVEVPEGCAVTIESRFGTTEVADIRGGVTIHGDHSQIQVGRCGGTLAVDNSMGEIRVEGFNGPATIENSHAEIVLSDIRGDVIARNTFAQTSIAHSRGDLNFDCKGSIQIEDHRGNATLVNSTGSTTIQTLVGDVKLTSSFGSVELEQIEGGITIRSQSGSIRAANIEGLCTIESKGGNFEVSEIGGPLHLTNIDGTAEIELNIPLEDASTIESTRGRVSVRLAEDADVQIKVRATRGSVRGADRLRIVERGSTYTAEGSWGASRSTLTITGEDATIQISDN